MASRSTVGLEGGPARTPLGVTARTGAAVPGAVGTGK
jgi:hypothetical protein